MKTSRRAFLSKMITVGGVLLVNPTVGDSAKKPANLREAVTSVDIFRSLNGTPAENLACVIDLTGGIEKLIGIDDVVLIKPNVQWWNQGAPNLAALKTLVDIVMARPGGFRGEVVIAENCHRGNTPWTSESSGWAQPFIRNADLPGISNFGDLTEDLKKRYGVRYSTRHWIDVSAGSKRVNSPSEGPGYVYCDGTNGVPLLRCANDAPGSEARKTIMTYPIFSTDSGNLIDFRHGVWKNGVYTGRPLRFVNFPAFNHHSTYCGVTGAVKNYMGITDLSGGPDPLNGGRLTGTYYNFHSFPFNKWGAGPSAGMLGKEIGVFMQSVRKADLNIMTAEWVGLSSRVDPPVARTRAVLACTDPVALDYHAAKHLLHPNSGIPLHDPDRESSPARHYLLQCAEQSQGKLQMERAAIHSYDFSKRALDESGSLDVVGEIYWGRSLKPNLKYLYMRYFV
jgi:hypothetical protein